MATIKYSRQREEIKRYLQQHRDHPTADRIYQDLHKDDPKLSLGTVYRNLALLVRMGEVRKISAGDGPDRFDGNLSGHHHFICVRCSRVIDVPVGDQDRIVREISEKTDARVDSLEIHAYGLCGTCAAS